MRVQDLLEGMMDNDDFFFPFVHQTLEGNKPIITLVIPRICSPTGSVFIPLGVLLHLDSQNKIKALWPTGKGQLSRCGYDVDILVEEMSDRSFLISSILGEYWYPNHWNTTFLLTKIEALIWLVPSSNPLFRLASGSRAGFGRRTIQRLMTSWLSLNSLLMS